MTAIPRIRSRLAQIEEPEDMKGKWAFEISIWTLDGETKIGTPIGPFGPYNTEKEAQIASRGAVKLCCENYEMETTGKILGKYLDMKTAIMRPWEEQ